MSLVSQVITLLARWLTGEASGGALSLICLPVGAGAALLGFVANVGIAQWVARRLDGTGTYEDLVPVAAAYQAPLTVIWAVLSLVASWVPAAGFRTLPVSGYLLVLQMVAIKAVNRFGWGRPMLAALAPVVVVLLIVGAVAVVLALAGLSPRDMFGTGYWTQ
jgi:hypothetical protein